MSFVQTQEKEKIKKTAHHPLSNLLKSIQSKIIGQHQIIEQMLCLLLTDGHALLEGMPGLAKTRSAKAIADGIEGPFTAYNSPRIYSLPISSEPKFTFTRKATSSSAKVHFLTISSSPMRSTVPLQKYNRPCSRQWKKSK